MGQVDPSARPVVRLESEQEDGVLVLRLVGELDLSNIDGLRSEIEPLLQDRPDRVAVDVAKLEFIDSQGIALLLTLAERVPHFQVRNPSDAVRRIIDITALGEALGVSE